MSYRITTYKDAFGKILEMPINEQVMGYIKSLEEEGYNEKSITFTIWKKQDKLRVYKDDGRFFAILRNEVGKYSWKKDDPRWEEYWNKKNEQERVKSRKDEADAYKIDLIIRDEVKEKAFGKKATGYVYFIQGYCGGAIKIGYSKEPETRLKSLQTGYPDTLRILLLVPGSEKTEQYFHMKFEIYKLQGEWYKPDQVLLDYIEDLKGKYAN